ncbi:hypothetical protein DFH11DRAFT_1826639, partial [Phellopilus nigrolimitatus]
EILSHIFVSCGEADPNKPSASATPLVLTQVCKTWNGVINGSPRLWTGIKLTNGTMIEGRKLSPKTFLGKLSRWIKNSKDVPICINFSYMHLPSHSTYQEYCKEMKDIVDLLLTCQHRWQTLKVYVEDFSVVQGLLDAMTNLDNAPLLREFELHVKDRKVKNYPVWKAKCTTLTLHPKGRHSGYARLTDLQLFCSPSAEFIMWWIQQAPNLKTLEVTIDIKQPEHLQLPPLQKWKHGNLSKLHISGFAYPDITPLLAHLTLPALTDIKVDMRRIGYNNWTFIGDLLHRSNPQALKNLIIDNASISEADKMTCLEQSPSLVYLKIAPMTDTILDALTARSGNHPYCPDLESLEISYSMTTFNFGKLCSMVHSRSPNTR